MKNPFHRTQNALILGVILLLIGLGWYVVIRQSQVLTQATMVAYQQTELELVQSIARSLESYASDQARAGEAANITALEQEIFERFIIPVKLLEHGDTWIYAPDRVVFNDNTDFPEEYRNKSVGEIFQLQAKAGASHYEEMADAISNAREGVSWYIWLPDK